MDVAVREPALGAVLVVDGREDVGVRPQVAHLEEHAVGAAHAHEEVVHERDALWGFRAWQAGPVHGARSLSARRRGCAVRAPLPCAAYAPPPDSRAACRGPARGARGGPRAERRRRAVRRPLRRRERAQPGPAARTGQARRRRTPAVAAPAAGAAEAPGPTPARAAPPCRTPASPPHSPRCSGALLLGGRPCAAAPSRRWRCRPGSRPRAAQGPVRCATATPCARSRSTGAPPSGAETGGVERVATRARRAPAGAPARALPGACAPAGARPSRRPRLGAGAAARPRAHARLILSPANTAPLAEPRNVVYVHDLRRCASRPGSAAPMAPGTASRCAGSPREQAAARALRVRGRGAPRPARLSSRIAYGCAPGPRSRVLPQRGPRPVAASSVPTCWRSERRAHARTWRCSTGWPAARRGRPRHGDRRLRPLLPPRAGRRDRRRHACTTARLRAGGGPPRPLLARRGACHAVPLRGLRPALRRGDGGAARPSWRPTAPRCRKPARARR